MTTLGTKLGKVKIIKGKYKIINGQSVTTGRHYYLLDNINEFYKGLNSYKIVKSKKKLNCLKADEANELYFVLPYLYPKGYSKEKNMGHLSRIIRFDCLVPNRLKPGKFKIEYHYLKRPVMNNGFHDKVVPTDRMIAYSRAMSKLRTICKNEFVTDLKISHIIPLEYEYSLQELKDCRQLKAFKNWKRLADNWHDNMMKFTPQYMSEYNNRLYDSVCRMIPKSLATLSNAYLTKFKLEQKKFRKIVKWSESINTAQLAAKCMVPEYKIPIYAHEYREYILLSDYAMPFDVFIHICNGYTDHHKSSVGMGKKVLHLDSLINKIIEKINRPSMRLTKMELEFEIFKSIGWNASPEGNFYRNISKTFYKAYFSKSGKLIRKLSSDKTNNYLWKILVTEYKKN